MAEPVLCYVREPWAFFTTRLLFEQWGDDWSDAPYEHNAGYPYTFSAHDAKQGTPPWEIVRVAYDGDMETPADLGMSISVEEVNAGRVPWLQTSRRRSGLVVVIPAGTAMDRFCELVRAAGGSVYRKETPTNG